MKKYFVVFFIVTNVIFAQNKLNFDFDYARFKYDSTSVFTEIYYNISQNSLSHLIKNDSVFVGATINIEIVNEGNQTDLMNNTYQVINSFPLADSIQNQNLIGRISYLLSKGSYNLKITVSDSYSENNSKTISDKIIISPYNADNFMLSDIQLAANIIKDGANPDSYFYKNSYEIIPNAISVYGDNLPVLFYYNELYNISDERYKNNLILERLVVNSFGKIVNKKSREIKSNNNSIVEAGQINLMKYPSGTYNLVLNLVDTLKNIGLTSNKKFYLINKAVVDTQKYLTEGYDLLSSEFGAMEIEEVDEMFATCRYIASVQERNQYEKLDGLDAKKEFLFNFWKKRDPSPETPENEFKNDYMKRVEYARTKFTEFQKNGALTDRGRVYLMYGEPDEIDYKHNQVDTKPYQIWYYNSIEGGVEFIFADLSGYSQFELIHSNKRSELHDENYMNRIKAAKDY